MNSNITKRSCTTKGRATSCSCVRLVSTQKDLNNGRASCVAPAQRTGRLRDTIHHHHHNPRQQERARERQQRVPPSAEAASLGGRGSALERLSGAAHCSGL
ncbi:hypothetical protein O3P69_009829 [Scylla paramamosain]|uniref:Uncharacterized protein n=1 Tax=Scylla paramamosain TaxID=85552 RepID=A0AAW0SNT7_SCYPA